MKKTALAVALICPMLLSGCGTEIDDTAYVVAIGVDKAEEGYNFTFAIGDPGSINGGGGEGEKGDSNTLILKESQGDNIFTAGDAVGAAIGQRINFSHGELIVFSEAVASDGVEILLDAITRNLDQRPKLVPVVSSGEAREVVSAIKPEFEGNPEKYLKKIFESEISPVSANVDNRKLLSRIKNPDAGVIIPRVAKADGGIATDSVAVFKGGRLVSVAEDVYPCRLIQGTPGSISYDVANYGTLLLTNRSKPKISVKCGDTVDVDVNICLTATLQAMSDSTGQEHLIKTVSAELENRVQNLLLRSAAEWGVDMFAFERYAKSNFLTLQKWQNYNWQEKYKTARFNVGIDIVPEKTTLIRGGT